MGKLHSKHGDSFVVNACLARKGLDDWMVKQKYYCPSSRVDQQDSQQKNTCGLSPRDLLDEGYAEGISDERYRLEVALPPEKTDSCSAEERMQDTEGSATVGPHKQLQFEELECAVSVEEDNRQEWTFTLYDFDNNGKVTREDITSLLHTIYEVVDASVNHSPSSSVTMLITTTSKLASGTVWMRTWREETITLTWLALKTTHPALEQLLPQNQQNPTIPHVHPIRHVHVLRNQRMGRRTLLTIGAHRPSPQTLLPSSPGTHTHSVPPKRTARHPHRPLPVG
ncbi:hypothetical protein cypCar_00028471 [Cyprinus carpio]|nr:hypothetical protein cypCar_00028471 [Cyprinus carpio]